MLEIRHIPWHRFWTFAGKRRRLFYLGLFLWNDVGSSSSHKRGGWKRDWHIRSRLSLHDMATLAYGRIDVNEFDWFIFRYRFFGEKTHR